MMHLNWMDGARWLAALGLFSALSLVGAGALAQPTPIAIGDTVTGAVTDPDTPVEFEFAAAPGERVYLEPLAASNPGGLNWALKDAFGRVIAQNLSGFEDLGAARLMGGAYTVSIVSEAGGLGTFEFRVAPSPERSFEVALGDELVGEIAEPGEVHAYTFDAAPGQRLMLDSLLPSDGNARSLNLELRDQHGRVVLERTPSLGDYGPFLLDGGPMTLTIQTERGLTANYRLVLAAPVVEPPEVIRLGEAFSGEVVTPGGEVSYALTVEAGQVVFVAPLSSSNPNGLNLRLTSPRGRVVIPRSSRLDPAGPVALSAGEHTLTVLGEFGATGTFEIVVHDANPVRRAIALEEVVVGELSAPGGATIHELTLTEPARVVFDLLSASNSRGLNLIVREARGREIVARTPELGDVGPLGLLAGTYAIEIVGERASVGSWEFAVREVEDGQAVAALGDTVSGEIAVSGERDAFTFTVPPMRSVRVDVLATSNRRGLNWRLTDSLGREIATLGDLDGFGPLPLVGGDYTLTVVPERGQLGTYTFALLDEGPVTTTPTGAGVTLGAEIIDDIGVAGEEDRHVFTLAEATRVFLDLQVGDRYLEWSLLDPAGHPVFADASARFPEGDDAGAFDLAAGSYTVVLRGVGDATPSYQLRALAVVDEERLVTLGEPISGQIATPGQRHRLTLRLAQERRIHLALDQGERYLHWELLDPVGQPVFTRAGARFPGGDDEGSWVLPAGDYVLTLDSDRGLTPEYGLTFFEASDVVEPYTLGAAVSGSLPSRGSTWTYTFEVTEPGAGYFDISASSQDTRWALISPEGEVVEQVTGQEREVGPVPLTVGVWSMVVSDDERGLTSWTLRGRAVAPAVEVAAELGEALSGSFDSPGQARRFTFELESPTRAFFDTHVISEGVSASLRTEAGVVVFEGLELTSVDRSYAGPWVLPAGTLTLELIARSADPPPYDVALYDASVRDGGPIAFNTLVEGALEVPGKAVSYTVTVEPGQEGLEVLFDTMVPGTHLRWEVLDPVGQPLFALRDADASHADQGEFPLAAGTYTLTLDAGLDATPSYILRVRDQTPLALPDGCASCGALDVVFVFDTSGSMSAEATQVCELANDITSGLTHLGIPSRTAFFGITNAGTIPCVEESVAERFGPAVPGAPAELGLLDVCPDGTGNHPSESWMAAATIVAERYPWSPDAARLIIPVGDEGGVCGNPVDVYEDLGADLAVNAARVGDVVVSPILSPGIGDAGVVGAMRVAAGTLGRSTETTFEPAQLADQLTAITATACAVTARPARPALTGVQPAPGASLPAGTVVTLTGQVSGVNAFRPIDMILINGEPVDAVDASGRFFKAIVVEGGENTLEFEFVEGCGSTRETIALVGEVDVTRVAEGVVDVSQEVEVVWSDTTFDEVHARLLADVAVTNAGAEALPGPIFVSIGADLSPQVTVLTADGRSPTGEPWVTVVSEGSALAPGATSAARTVAFEDPARAPARFTSRVVTPTNRAPTFASVPQTQASPGALWSYRARAIDPDGDTVTYALTAGPRGMALDAATGLLTWTPTEAEEGAHDVAIVADDGRRGRATQRFALTVGAPSNRPPLFTSVPVTRAGIGGEYVYEATVEELDGDPLTFEVSGPSGVEVSAAGRVTWGFALPGVHVVTLQVTDGRGGGATQRWELSVGEQAANPSAPVFTSVPPTLASAGALWLYQPVVSDPDGDAVTFVLEAAPPGALLAANTGRLRWPVGEEQVGEHAFALTAVDGRGGRTTQTFTVAVQPDRPNASPLFTSSPPLFAVAAEPYAAQLEAIDPEGGAVTYALIAGPLGMAVTEGGALTWTPEAADQGPVPVAVAATDPLGATASQAWIIDARGSNSPPVITSAPVTGALSGGLYGYRVAASDPDGDALTFRLTEAPEGMTVDARTGLIVWRPVDDDEGANPVTVQVEDCCGEVDAQSFEVEVEVDRAPPSVTIRTSSPICAGVPAEVCVGASDDRRVDAVSLTVDGVAVTLDPLGCATVAREAPV